MRRSVTTTILLMEMNLLLGPLSLAFVAAAAMMTVMGFPHGLELVVVPLLRGDLQALAIVGLVPSAWLALREAWTLGILTVRRERYDFGVTFWLALGISTAAVAAYARYLGPAPFYVLAPVWLFVGHMAFVQLRTSTRSAS